MKRAHATSGSPPGKKPRSDDLSLLSAKYRGDDALAVAAMRKQYRSGAPYPHIRLAEFLDPAFLKGVLHEVAQMARGS